jgi:hypothetical protein
VDWNALLGTAGPLIGVALGAGLTYLFGALNRRHQESREDQTRWYDTRFQAYVGFFRAVVDATGAHYRKDSAELERAELAATLATVRFVGSPEVVRAAHLLFKVAMDATLVDAEPLDAEKLGNAVWDFGNSARKDLGQTTGELIPPHEYLKGDDR